MWTETERKMITEDGNVRRYIGSNTRDRFDLWDCADISFPNGYNKGGESVPWLCSGNNDNNC